MASNEKLIRQLCKDFFIKKYPSAIIRDEFTSNKLATRNDLFVIDESEDIICSVEIKSDGDNLNRLAAQITEYKTYSNLVYVALDIKHLKKYSTQFKDTELFVGVGLLVYNSEFPNELTLHKRATKRKFPFLYHLLWSSELKLFTKNLKGRSKIGSNEKDLCRMIECIYTYDEIRIISRHLFIERHKKLENSYRIEPDLDNQLIEEMIKYKQQSFTNYIGG